jgi:integrase
MVEKRYSDDFERKFDILHKKLKDNPQISKANKEVFEKYLNACTLMRNATGGDGFTFATLRAKVRDIIPFFELLGNNDIKEAMHDRDLINSTFSKLKTKKKMITFKTKNGFIPKQSNKIISPATYKCYVNTVKAFVKWLNDGETPKGFKDIRQGSPALRIVKKSEAIKKLREEDMITYEDIQAMKSVTKNVLQHMLLDVLIEGGNRVGELMNARIKDVKKDNEFITIRVDGKTGERDVVFIYAVPSIMKWLELHPDPKPNQFLFVKRTAKGKIMPYRYSGLRAIPKRLGKKAGIKKPLDLHNFIHSSIAFNKEQNNLSLDLLSRQYGKSVRTLGVYGSLGTGAIKRAIRKHRTVECPICKTVNDKNSAICSNCRNTLKLDVAINLHKKREEEVTFLKHDMEKLQQSNNVFRKAIVKVLKQFADKDKVDEAVEILEQEGVIEGLER